jgi:phenylalanyl-tRNA synthetase beta chain
VDFFDAKGYLETLFASLSLYPAWVATEEFGLLSGRTAAIRLGDTDVGIVGQVHPDLAAQFDIEGDAYLFEIRLDRLLGAAEPVRSYRPYSSFPAVEQDLALVVDADTPAAAVLAIIREGRYVVSARLFDEYTGERVPPGKKSLAFAVSFQSPEKTLTDEDVTAARRRLIATLERRLGATLRG